MVQRQRLVLARHVESTNCVFDLSWPIDSMPKPLAKSCRTERASPRCEQGNPWPLATILGWEPILLRVGAFCDPSSLVIGGPKRRSYRLVQLRYRNRIQLSVPLGQRRMGGGV